MRTGIELLRPYLDFERVFIIRYTWLKELGYMAEAES